MMDVTPISESDITNLTVIRQGQFPVLDRIGLLADQNDLSVFVVGGFVRDQLLSRSCKDLDFSVLGDALNFGRLVARELGVFDPIEFERFKTVRVPYRGMELDFVTAREESYTEDSRKPVVRFSGLREDLARRDFTVNAMAASLNREIYGRVIDLFDGQSDLSARLLRTPLDPVVTFSDDPLRMLRAVRFAAQLEFEIDPVTLDAISGMVDRLRIVSQERITEEFLKLLRARKPSIGIRLMHETGLMKAVFPEISQLAGVDQIGPHHHKDVFDHTLLVVDQIAELTDDVELRFAALVHDIAKPRTKRFVPGTGWTFHGHEDVGSRMMKSIGRKFRLPDQVTERVSKLVALHMRPMNLTGDAVTDSGIRRLVVDSGDDLEGLMTLCRADITSQRPAKVKYRLEQYEELRQRISEVLEKDNLRAFQSPVRGDEIMAVCNIGPGRLVGQIKQALEEAILDGVVPNEHDAVLEYLHTIKHQLFGINS